MTNDEKSSRGNVIDLASERRRQSARKSSSHAGKPPGKKPAGKWGLYLQVIVFLAILWYMMRSCGM